MWVGIEIKRNRKRETVFSTLYKYIYYYDKKLHKTLKNEFIDKIKL